jgi:hypothetical protein
VYSIPWRASSFPGGTQQRAVQQTFHGSSRGDARPLRRPVAVPFEAFSSVETIVSRKSWPIGGR